MNSLLSATSPLFKATDSLFKVTGPLFKVTGPLFKVTGPLFKVTSPLFKVTGPLFKMTGPLFKVTGPLFKVKAILRQGSLIFCRELATFFQLHSSRVSSHWVRVRSRVELFRANDSRQVEYFFFFDSTGIQSSIQVSATLHLAFYRQKYICRCDCLRLRRVGCHHS